MKLQRCFIRSEQDGIKTGRPIVTFVSGQYRMFENMKDIVHVRAARRHHCSAVMASMNVLINNTKRHGILWARRHCCSVGWQTKTSSCVCVSVCVMRGNECCGEDASVV